ncbi:MAG: type VI secretion system protein TssA [Alteromonadaceae bacterium]|nr:type VI secretion system protein TssA [Alteromonadaceae bacterium]
MDYDQLISSEVSDVDVCGVNLEDDSSFQNYFFEAEGTPERFDGQKTIPAEPPEWRTIKKQAVSYMKQTRDLKLISIMAQSVLNTEGLLKFEQCLSGILGLVTNQWTEVFPSLDEDDGDPLERISALGHLSDQNYVISVLKDTVIAESKVFGKVTLRLIDRANDNSATKTDSDLDLSQIRAIFTECNDGVTDTYNSINLCLSNFESINQVFVEQAGNNYNVNFDNVCKTLTHLAETLEKYGNVQSQIIEESVETEAGQTEQVDGENKTPVTNQTSSNTASIQSAGMKLTSRQDVEKCFDIICDYYKQYEPSSPIPVLINRSKKLVHMNFFDIVKEILPDSLDQINKLGGITAEEETSSSDSSW